MGSEAPDRPIELRVGDEHVLRLAGFGTAGYRWAAEVREEPGVVDVERLDVEPAASEAVGASGGEAFSIRANHPGETRIELALRRPWESADVPAADERSVRIRVI